MLTHIINSENLAIIIIVIVLALIILAYLIVKRCRLALNDGVSEVLDRMCRLYRIKIDKRGKIFFPIVGLIKRRRWWVLLGGCVRKVADWELIHDGLDMSLGKDVDLDVFVVLNSRAGWTTFLVLNYDCYGRAIKLSAMRNEELTIAKLNSLKGGYISPFPKDGESLESRIRSATTHSILLSKEEKENWDVKVEAVWPYFHPAVIVLCREEDLIRWAKGERVTIWVVVGSVCHGLNT